MRHIPDGRDGPGVVFMLRKGRIYGWVKRRDDNTYPIAIRVNGILVANALPDRNIVFRGNVDYVPFLRPLRELWRYLGWNDVITVEYDGVPLPIAGWGRFYRRLTPGSSRVPELAARLANGYIFSKGGRLLPALGHNAEWQRNVHDHFKHVARLIRAKFGYVVFPIYGTLLGAVREGNYIKNDDDFDATYISRHSTRDAIIKEVIDICQFVSDQGFAIEFRKRSVKIRDRKNGSEIDLFWSWFDDQDNFRISYGYHGPEQKKSEAFFRFEDAPIGNFKFAIPENSEEIVLQLYGEGWRFPNPGFSHRAVTIKADPAYFMSESERERFRTSAGGEREITGAASHWNTFYRTHSFSEPSTFATFVEGFLPGRKLIVELGCGEGRDAIFFANRGNVVFAIDRSTSGIERAHEKCEDRQDQLRFLVGDLAERPTLESLLGMSSFTRSRDGDTPLVFYMRFFLHAVPEDTEDAILNTVVDLLQDEVFLAAEFRTNEDAGRLKTHGDHFRRYIKPSEFCDKLVDLGFRIIHENAGTGLSVVDGEDPHLCRVVARKPASGT